jgi:predicted nucleic acid-binding protein
LIYVDSNYWIYWLDSRLPEHERVVPAMRKAITEGVAASYVTLFEVAHYLRMLPRREFVERMEQIRSLSTITLFELDGRLADSALRMVPEYASVGLGGRDCIILATMKASGINRIATHNQAFARVDWVEVVDGIPRSRNS